MSEGLSDSETQVGENSVGDWPESDSAPTAAINGFGNPDGPMSRGIKRPRDFLGMRFYPRTTEVYEQNVGLGQQQQQLGEPSWEVRNNVAVDDRNISTNIPYEGPNPQQVEGHGSDSASSFMNGYALRITPMGRVSLLKLVEKMTREFFLDASGSSTNMWMTLPLHGNEDIKITVKNRAHSFGFLGGRTIVLSTSVEIPVPPKRVFSLLSAAESRPKNTTPENTDAPMFYLQKSYIDPTFAYVVYAPIDVPAMSMLLSGGDPESVAFMTSGFMMFPDRPILPGEESSGSLLTVLFHILDDAPREDHYCLSLNSLNVSHSLISGTVGMIKDNFIRGHQRSGGRRGN
ncbi:hypothetical protein CRG98_011880 [Punica granatum]|uniref:HD-Zip IV C-terminal domain-containing protein n=1 Tax=Punica granatum TaxID=22663 RepID=A0A2I0KGM6_PUNGR|nr:hypothetical protein CRG98_011880 [Punica granatum]